jgi:nucleoid-associated protein YgaU
MSRDILWASIAVGVLTVVVAIAFLVPGQKPADPTPSPVADAGFSPSDPFAQPAPADPFAFPAPGTTAALPPLAPPPLDPIMPLPAPGVDPFAPVGQPPLGGLPVAPIDPAPVAAPAPEGKTHTVVKGDLLGDISRKYYGTSRHWKLIAEANPGANPDNLKVGTVLTIPPAPGSAPRAAAPQAGEGSYVVQKGDSYHSIAKKMLGATSRWKEIETLNGIPPGELKPGQTLRLPPAGGAAPVLGAPAPDAGVAPVAGGRTHTVAKGEYLSDISKNYYGTTRQWQKIAAANPGVNPNNLKVGATLVIPEIEGAGAPAVGAAPGAAPAAGGRTYTVAKGDTGGDIARKTLGSARRWAEIAAANPGVNANNLKIGQVLQIPGGGAADPVAAPVIGGPAASGIPGAPAPAPEPAFQDPFLELGLPPAGVEPSSPAGTPAPPSADPFRL